MVEKTIQTALEPDPEQRFQSAEEMRQALEAALREPEEKRRRRRRIGLTVVGSMLVLMFGIGAAAASKPDIRARAWAATQPLIQKLRGAPSAEVAATSAALGEEPAAAEEGADDGEQQPSAQAEQKEGSLEGTPSAEPSEAEEGETAAEATADAPEKEPETTDKQAIAKTEPVAPSEDDLFSAAPVKESSGDKVEAGLAKAQELMAAGKKIKAINEYRRIGKRNPKDVRALKAWSETAAQMKGYGEALRVAQRWASVDRSVEARMHLANMQRKVGKHQDVIKTLNELLAERPGLGEARAMLKSMSPEPRVARR